MSLSEAVLEDRVVFLTWTEPVSIFCLMMVLRLQVGGLLVSWKRREEAAVRC